MQRIKIMKKATSMLIHRHAEVSKFLSIARVGKGLRNLLFLFFASLPAIYTYVNKYSSQNIRVTKSRSMTGGTYSTHDTNDKNVLYHFILKVRNDLLWHTEADGSRVLQDQRYACVAQHSTSVVL